MTALLEPTVDSNTRQIRIFTNIAKFLLGLGLVPLIFGIYLIRDKYGDLATLSSLGSFWQGSVGSIWSLASVLYIYVAFLGQQQQSKQQEQELIGQQEQFKKQQEQFDKQQAQFEQQQKSIEQQNFEAAFFQLLSLQNQIAEQLQFHRPSHSRIGELEVFHGRECFLALHGELERRFQYLDNKDRGSVCCIYEEIYKKHQVNLGHYFRNLYHVLKFVTTRQLTGTNQRQYTSLVRAQLSAYELTMLFYNGLSRRGEGMKPLIEKFGLLEHLELDTLLDPSHEKWYTDSAYR